jgi:Transposase DDE domain
MFARSTKDWTRCCALAKKPASPAIIHSSINSISGEKQVATAKVIRKRIEEAFGWIKTVAGQQKTRFRGRDRVGWAFAFSAAAYNLVRLPKLMAQVG